MLVAAPLAGVEEVVVSEAVFVNGEEVAVLPTGNDEDEVDTAVGVLVIVDVLVIVVVDPDIVRVEVDVTTLILFESSHAIRQIELLDSDQDTSIFCGCSPIDSPLDKQPA